MEARVIRGPEYLMQQVRELTGPDKMWSSKNFFQAKLQEQAARHINFADTEYNLEPTVNSPPGRLRDLQSNRLFAEPHLGLDPLDYVTT